MSKFTESLVNGLVPVIGSMAAEQLVGLLNQYASNDKKNYTMTIKALYPAVSGHLVDIAKKSKGKIDDVVVQALKQAIEESAAENDVELKEV